MYFQIACFTHSHTYRDPQSGYYKLKGCHDLIAAAWFRSNGHNHHSFPQQRQTVAQGHPTTAPLLRPPIPWPRARDFDSNIPRQSHEAEMNMNIMDVFSPWFMPQTLDDDVAWPRGVVRPSATNSSCSSWHLHAGRPCICVGCFGEHLKWSLRIRRRCTHNSSTTIALSPFLLFSLSVAVEVVA